MTAEKLDALEESHTLYARFYERAYLMNIET